MVRTGYESVMAQRTTATFAYSADNDGVVTGIKDKGIIVTYSDGTTAGYALGRIYGNAEGSTYPHDIVTPLKLNDKFKKGDILVYNTGFFEPDFLNPKQVIWKSSVTVKTALYESSQTHEDSSSISTKVAGLLRTKTTKVRSIVVDFNQGIRSVLKAGSKVKPKDFLCVLEDSVTDLANLLDDTAIETLKRLGNKAPKAKYTGVLDKIEILYHGDKEDMSVTLKELANHSDRLLAESTRATGKRVMTGSVNSDYRVAGTPLGLDTAEIKFYITVATHTGQGDKTVFSNQLKSVIGEVMDYEMTTESGTPIDAVFGALSIANRIVCSPDIIGTTNTLLKIIGQQAVNIYKGTKK